LQINIALYEEAEQSFRREYTALKTNLRKGQKGLVKSIDGRYTFQNMLIMCLNPPEEIEHYIIQMYEKKEDYKDTIFLHTTIDDNDYATEQDYIDLEEIRKFDEQDYQRYRFGKCVPRSEGLIFKINKHYEIISLEEFENHTKFSNEELEILENWKDVDREILEQVQEKQKKIKYLIHVYGLDFSNGVGRDPLVLLENFVDYNENVIYCKPLIFNNSLDSTPVILNEFILNNVSKHDYIFGDSANQLTIRDMYEAGYNIEPCEKTQIIDGIRFLKGFKICFCVDHLDEDVETLVMKQITQYSYLYDIRKEYFTSKPDPDKNADVWDALRYGVNSYYIKFLG